MAKRKKKRGKQSMVSKVINIGGILIGMSRVIQIVWENIGNPREIGVQIVRGATFGLSEGALNTGAGMAFYTPVAGAVGYRYFTSYLLKKFPVR